MAIQYAGGTIVNSTFTDDGSRADLVTHLRDALTTAGWSVVSGGGTTDVVMKSAVTPSGLSISVRIYDPGSGNCAQIFLRNEGGSKVSTACYLLPGSNQWRIIANKYQFFYFATGAGDYMTARKIATAGAPYVPDFILDSLGNLESGWLVHTGYSDIGASARASWRSALFLALPGSYPDFCTIWNGTITENAGGTWYGGPSLPCAVSGYQESGLGLVWYDGSFPVEDAIVGFHSGGTGLSGTIRWAFQLWDAIVIFASYTSEAVITFDGHTFMAITHGSDRGTLFVRVA